MYSGYSKEEKERLRVEDETDNAEVMIRCLDEMTDAVTLPILARYSQKDRDMKKIHSALMKGKECPADLENKSLETLFRGMVKG